MKTKLTWYNFSPDGESGDLVRIGVPNKNVPSYEEMTVQMRSSAWDNEWRTLKFGTPLNEITWHLLVLHALRSLPDSTVVPDGVPSEQEPPKNRKPLKPGERCSCGGELAYDKDGYIICLESAKPRS